MNTIQIEGCRRRNVYVLGDMLIDIQQRRESLGYVDGPAAIESMRNKSGQRTPEKCELLRRAEACTRLAGWKPVFTV